MPAVDLPQAVLRRWDEHPDDYTKKGSDNFSALVKTRPLARIMKFADYDHDGKATEFLLQIGNLPCAKRMMVAVGISVKNHRLHVFGSVKRPNQPLILTSEQWDALRKARGKITVLQWSCGDHGSGSEEAYQLRANNGDIYAISRTYDCTKDDKRGALLKEEEF